MPKVIIDWKLVSILPETVENFDAQVRSYFRIMGIANGLIVFVTLELSGRSVHSQIRRLSSSPLGLELKPISCSGEAK
jgi:hypothetical protein